MHDDLYFDWTRAVSIRGWSLMDHLNRHIRACQETGLYMHWELEVTFLYRLIKIFIFTVYSCSMWPSI